MASRSRSRPKAAKPTTDRWRLAIFVVLVLGGGAPIAYASFTRSALLDLHVGPFHLFPLMLWPGLVASGLGGLLAAGWRPPRLVSMGAALGYPLLVAGAAAGLALAFGWGKLVAGVSATGLGQTWSLAVLGSLAGSLFTVLGEEIGWRGFLQRRLEPSGPNRAILLTSLVATAFHALALMAPAMRSLGGAGAVSFLASVFLLQVALGLLYQAGGGSIWPVFLMHVVWNATNPILTGEIYGGEGGLLGGQLWLINGEGLAGAIASILLLGPLWLGVRALRRRSWSPPTGRARLAWGLVGGALLVAGSVVTLRAKGEPAPGPAPVVDGASVSRPAPTQQLRDRARAALGRALDFLDRERGALSLDAVYLLRLIEGALPSSDAGAIAKRGLAAAKRDPTYALFAEIVAKPHPPQPTRPLPPYKIEGKPNPKQAFDEKFSDQCLNGALKCQWAPGCRRYKTQLGQWGYVLSHQVLFFLFAQEKGCRWDVKPSRWLGHLCRAMLVEHRADARFTDLFAERMALGAQAGFREFLRDEWIEIILAAEKKKGCWYWEPDDPRCNDHTVGMAAWALALYLRGSDVVKR